MKHPDDEQVRRYVGRQLTGKGLLNFESHLEGCRDCRREVEAYRAIDRAIAALPEPEWAPERLLAEVARGIREGRRPRPLPLPMGRFWRLASLTAGLVAVLGVALYAENAHFWHGVQERNNGLYAEHYSFVTTPAARTVSLVSGVNLP
ncbi:MAG: anti-sigma factor family protein [Methanocella sp.]